MLVSIPDIMIKQLTNNNVFGYLLDCISKYEWNSIVLVEIEKILKLCLCIGQKTNKPNAESEDKNSQIEAIYNGLFVQSNFSSRLRELMRKESEKGKINCGYSGFLNNLCTHIKSLIKSETVIGGLIKGNQSDLLELMDNYLKNKQVETNEGFLVVHDVAKPHYSISNTK